MLASTRTSSSNAFPEIIRSRPSVIFPATLFSPPLAADAIAAARSRAAAAAAPAPSRSLFIIHHPAQLAAIFSSPRRPAPATKRAAAFQNHFPPWPAIARSPSPLLSHRTRDSPAPTTHPIPAANASPASLLPVRPPPQVYRAIPQPCAPPSCVPRRECALVAPDRPCESPEPARPDSSPKEFSARAKVPRRKRKSAAQNTAFRAPYKIRTTPADLRARAYESTAWFP